MKIILWAVSLIVSLNAQIIDERFGNWKLNPSISGVVGDFYFGNNTCATDLSGNSNDLTPHNFQANFDTSLIDFTNPVMSGDSVLHFYSGSSQYFSSASDSFEIHTDDWTIEMWIWINSEANYMAFFDKGGGYNTGNPGYRSFILPSTRVVTSSISSAFHTYNANPAVIQADNVGKWVLLEFAFDRNDRLKVYENSTLYSAIVANISSLDGEDVDAGPDVLNLFSRGTSYYLNGYVANLRILNRLKTDSERIKDYNLASGWYSTSSKVYRNSLAFEQGFFNGDTVYYPVADTSNQSGYHWSATFDAYGGKAGDAITMYLGSGTAVTQTLTASSKSYTLNLGTVTTSSDSLYMIASAGDTVYVDNLVVTEAAIATDTPQRNFRNYNKWSGFKP